LNVSSEQVNLGLAQSIIGSSKEEFDTMPEVGDMAPDFELKSHLEKDKKVKLSDFRGQKNVVIAFYPLDWTPV
jgi:peroxiredoxin